MENTVLLKISIIISLVGILSMLFLAETLEVPLTKIKELEKKKIDEKIRVQGVIIQVKETPKAILFTLKDETGTITAIIFKEGSLILKKGQKVEVEGTLLEYQGKKEISVSWVKG